jgi:hypothetical protein
MVARRLGVQVSVAAVDGGVRIAVDDHVVRWDGDLSPEAEAGLVMALLPAMSAASDIHVRGELSVTLADNLERLQDVFVRWLPGAARVAIHAGRTEALPGARLGIFFSGGVDSFHALLKHRAEVERLVYVEGFDLPRTDAALQRQVRRCLQDAADSMGLGLTVLSTDLRAWSDSRIGWEMYHGAALATAAHLLAHEVGTMVVPSSFAYDELCPWGSHPLTDPLWSGQVRLVHSGSEVDRAQKIAAIVDDATARATLRVCYRNTGGTYNCGGCEKCLRTMTTLAAFGVLDAFTTFPRGSMTPSSVRQLTLTPDEKLQARDNIALLEEQGVHPELQDAWARALRRPEAVRRGLGRVRRARRSLLRRLRATP